MVFHGYLTFFRRIKKKKIFVISTLKRPVPLVYYLYTGNSTKTADEMFPIVDRKGKFLPHGHRMAVDAKKERSQTSKSKDNHGQKGSRSHANPNEAKRERFQTSKSKDNYGPKGTRSHVNPNEVSPGPFWKLC